MFDFPGKTQHFNIAERIGIHYQVVGTGLLKDDRAEVIPAIILEHGKNAQQISMDILSRWVQGKGIADRTWRGLLGVLRVHCPGLAQDIEETLRAEIDSSMGTSGASETNGMSSSPQQESPCNQKLRDWYAENPLPYYFDPRCYKWMPNVTKKYIHPSIISKDEEEEQQDFYKEAILRGERWRITEKDSGTTVQLEKLLEIRADENRRCILVEGGPGMGKSTLAWQVCHRWGRRELFSQYSTVLLLQLRDNEVQQAKQVDDLIKDDKELIQEIRNGQNSLVILDGLDELPSHLLSKRSIFTDLLSGKVLSDATILVTSRPSATQQLLACWKKRISKQFIIQGFSEGDIEKYAKSILSREKLTEFQKHLSIHPHIQSIMYVPLHSAIVMAVYLQHKQLPKTPTQLYMSLIEIILSQYLDDHPEYCGEEDIILRSIGIEVPKLVHAQFIQLCEVAFDTVCRQKLIFSDKTMPKVLHDLGFTDSVPGLYLHRTCSYNFLHLSIQEFLAAYHVSLLSPQEQEQLLLQSREEHHFENMMRFVAGLTKFQEIRKEVLKKVVVIFDEWSEFDEKYGLDVYSLELLFECQDMSVLDKEGTYNMYSPHWWSSYYPAQYCLALGYCIANSKCAWKLSFLKFLNTLMLLQGLKDCKTQPAYTIKHMEWKEFTDEECGTLLAQGSDYFITHIETITLSNNFISHYKLDARKQPHLTHFCQWLPTCHLKTLSLELHLLQPHDIEILSGALTAVPSLKTLDMSRSKFTFQSMKAFASMLQQNQSLTKLDISSCNMSSDSTCCLARALHSNTTLIVLDIYGNSVGTRGALAMAEMLKYNTTLTELNMGNNFVDERGPLTIVEMLNKHNTTLTVLNISNNSVGNKGALKLAEILKHNTH